MLWCVGWLPTGSSHTPPTDPARLSSARPAGFGLATRCLEVPGNASGIVRDVGFIGPLTRCRSGLTGMVATRGGYRRWRRSVLAILPIGAH